MSERFADSFVFLVMLNRQDRRHTAAVEALYASRDALVTTAWVVMRERGIVEALTGDRHFEQAGFVAVLR